MASIRVAITEDNDVFSLGLQTLICKNEKLTLTAVYRTGLELIQCIEKSLPDVILMDIIMPEMDGVVATEFITSRYPNIGVIAISMYDDKYNIDRMFKAGACAFINKELNQNILDEAITHAINGKKYISHTTAVKYICDNMIDETNKIDINKTENFENQTNSSKELSSRENEIIRLIGQGYSDKEISNKLFISSRTVESHKRNIRVKTGCRTTAEMVANLYGRSINP